MTIDLFSEFGNLSSEFGNLFSKFGNLSSEFGNYSVYAISFNSTIIIKDFRLIALVPRHFSSSLINSESGNIFKVKVTFSDMCQ